MSQLPELPGLDMTPEDDAYDSAIDAQSLASSTTSITESILKHREENGRTYHAYKEGKYVLPNDETEKDRLDLQHNLCSLTLGGKLFLCPAGVQNKLHHVLDVGTGTGIWAIDFADEHSEAEVLGIDLSAIQPSFVPPNLKFEVDDLEEDWTFKNKFDFIYTRMMVGSFADWPRYFRQVYDNLNPGGFIELLDCYIVPKSDDGTLSQNSALIKWGEYFIKGGAKMGRPADSCLSYDEKLKDAGFINIQKVEYKWPTNRWPKDENLKTLGLWTRENFGSSLPGLSIAVMTRVHGWSADEVEDFLADVKNEFFDTKIHAYFSVYVVWAEKPNAK